MKIDILPRTAFEKIKGTAEEMELLKSHRIISINSHDEQPPFSHALLSSTNLLCLTFDDICSEPPPDMNLSPAILFTANDALAILDFVNDASMPVLIHCTAGISRSGAVGECLDLYYNRWLCDNRQDHLYFLDNNRQIMPNPFVRHILLEAILGKP